MTRALRLRARAKINWTLEVLGKRADGYHEVQSVMQTIALGDQVTLRLDDEVSLTLSGSELDLPSEDNLAYQAASRLRGALGVSSGVRIEIEKHIPVAGGLGGGSSDAAAVLRGLRALWELSISDEELAAIGAELGSDVPFFLAGGTALASGRGELIHPLPDAPQQSVLLSSRPPQVAVDKTAGMYAALQPEHYTDGSRTAALAERIRRGEPVRDEDCFNVFELVLPEVDPEAAARFDSARDSGHIPHLCGSGPTYFTLGGGALTLPAREALAIEDA